METQHNNAHTADAGAASNQSLRPASELKVEIRAQHLTCPEIPDLQQRIIDIAVKAIAKPNAEKDMAREIKLELDQLEDTKENAATAWHVIVGRSFGSFVTHEEGRFIYFYVGCFAVVAFKA